MTMEVTEFIIKIVTCIVILASCIITVVQLINNARIKRIEYLEKLIEKFRSDKELHEVKCRIVRTNWFGPDFFNGDLFEQQVDRLLTFLCYMCYLKKTKSVSEREFDFFRFTIESILLTKQVQEYLFFLYNRSETVNRSVDKKNFPFQLLLEYGQEQGIIKEIPKREDTKSPKLFYV